MSSDQRPGSVLVFNFYTSGPISADKTDTEISITNLSASQTAFLHLFFVSNFGSTADATSCLTASQTITFMASDVDPGVTGYIVVIATDHSGRPLSFNYLVGSERFKMESGFAANLAAEGYAALFGGLLPGYVAEFASITLPLDGVSYTAAPLALGLDKIASSNDGNSTMLIINSLEGNLAIGIPPIKSTSGTLFDDAENAFVFSAPLIRNGPQFRVLLSDDFPQTTPKFTQVIKAGRTGWMRIMAEEGHAISGAVINFNPNAATRKGAFNGGHNLHHLRFGSGSFMMPVFPSSC